MAFSSWIDSLISDSGLSRTLARARLMLEEIQKKQIVDGMLLQSVSLTSGVVNNITHKLSRNPTGYIVVTRSADCRVWDDQITNTQKDIYLKLRTSANVVVTLWVF